MAAAAVIPEEVIKPFGAKADYFAYRPPRDDSRINILHGSVRSAKTWAMIPKIIYLCRYNVGGLRVFSGVSKQTIYDNVLNDIFNVIGSDAYRYNRMTGELEIMGSHWLVMGAKDEGSEKYLRGKTIGILYVDELTLLPKSFVMMALNRMSPTGARFYATTNPDNPYHFVKTDLLDNMELKTKGDLWSAHFTLDDNPNVTQDYKDFLNRYYTGVFRKRYVLGEWVVAEGSIYRDCWSEDLLYDDDTRPPGLLQRGGYADHFIACDYGTTHPHVYLDIYDDGTNLWVEREYVWDSQATMVKRVDSEGRVTYTPDRSGVKDVLQLSYQKTDAQYADDLLAFMGKDSDAQMIVPPEAASFDAELATRGIWKIDADNEVMDGIRMVSSMMAMKRIRFHRQNCAYTVAELPNYAWDEKAAKRGEEQPLKTKDDSADCVRYGVKTKVAPWRLLA